MIDPTPYIGIPFKECEASLAGADCWGLIAVVYRGEGRGEVASYGHYESLSDESGMTDELHAALEDWQQVAGEDPGEIAAKASQGDVLLFRFGYRPHVGLYLGGRMMLHTERGAMSHTVDFTGPRFRHRLLGAFRYG